jgi:drug/metabolite transporter (DMT)-like permease
MQQRDVMDVRATAIILVLCFLWGGNQVAIKLSNAGVAPIFGAAVRSVVAGTLVALWALARGRSLALRGRNLGDGLVVGAIFGVEFALIYVGLTHTTASHGSLMLNTSPFFVALGAHRFLPGEPLSERKLLGMVLAFGGVLTTLWDSLSAPSPQQIKGDLLVLGAGLLWAVNSLYIKVRVRDRMTPSQMLFYQLAVSAVLLGAMSVILEPRFIWLRTPGVLGGMVYQSVVVAFASYLVWFWLIQVYPVSLVSAYTFFSPVFGVGLGSSLLGEPLTAKLLLGAALVAGGMILVNWPANARPAAAPTAPA